ncbi:MAG: FAD/NAD(P)-binding protein [Pseudonocardiaceae bacterium]
MLVVGAGPHALTCCSYLLRQRPALHERLLAVDPDGWLTCWNRQFDALGIDRLRSHVIDHPDPEPYALWQFAQGPDKEMGPYTAPGVKLFADFCRTIIARYGLDEVLRRGRVERIVNSDQGLWAMLAAGDRILAQRVVLATNTRVPRLPGWARDLATQAPPGRILHTEELDLRGVSLAGERVMVIGSGLTAGQIALAALTRGATVTLVSRSRLRRQVFDVQGGWLTPTELRGFYAEPAAHRRVELIEAARRSSMTPVVVIALEEGISTGTIDVREGSEVQSATWDGSCWRVNLDQRTMEVHRIWLATGTVPRLDTGSLLAQVVVSRPTEVAGGLPVLDSACRWPGTEIHLMGGLAALQLGPAARNLVGARMAAERIVPCAVPLDRYQYVQPARPGTQPVPSRARAAT